MKFKAKAKEFQLLVKVKISKDEIIDEKELDRFSRAYIRGFLKPKQKKKDSIEYTGPLGITLCDRLKKPIAKREFLLIMEQVVVATQKIQANNLKIHNLVMNLQNIYINDNTKEVQFIYIPTVTGFQNSTLIDLIEGIAYSTIPGDQIDNNFIMRFLNFYRAMKEFSVAEIEKFIEREDRSVVNFIKKQNAGQSGFMTNKPQHYYNYYDQNKNIEEGFAPFDEPTARFEEDSKITSFEDSDDPTGMLSNFDDDATGLLNNLDDDATGLLNNSDDDATGLLNNSDGDATGLLNTSDDDATGLLTSYEDDVSVETEQFSENFARYKDPTLLRVLTQETIVVNKPVFRLGKERSYVDYFINNNSAVSRSHADIIRRNEKFFVMDLNSKNGTFINNRVIPVYFEIEICDGDSLKLGNEEFIFKV